MPDAYTRVSKPTDATWTNVNVAGGNEQYDQSNIIYDDPDVFYDGVDMFAWTKVAKPTGGGVITIRAGMATGLLIPLTYATDHTIFADDWTRINKPIT